MEMPPGYLRLSEKLEKDVKFTPHAHIDIVDLNRLLWLLTNAYKVLDKIDGAVKAGRREQINLSIVGEAIGELKAWK